MTTGSKTWTQKVWRTGILFQSFMPPHYHLLRAKLQTTLTTERTRTKHTKMNTKHDGIDRWLQMHNTKSQKKSKLLSKLNSETMLGVWCVHTRSSWTVVMPRPRPAEKTSGPPWQENCDNETPVPVVCLRNLIYKGGISLRYPPSTASWVSPENSSDGTPGCHSKHWMSSSKEAQLFRLVTGWLPAGRCLSAGWWGT